MVITAPSVSNARSNTILAIASIFWLMATISVLLRFWTKTYIVRSLGKDDWLMLVTLLFFSVFCAIAIVLIVLGGWGQNFIFTRPLNVAIDLLLVSVLFYILSALTLKLALGFFYLRIMVEKWQKFTIYAALIVWTLYGVMAFWITVFQCKTPFWYNKILNNCISYRVSLGLCYVHAILGSITDLIMASLPIPVIMAAKISPREKWIISIIVSLAGIGCVASFVRIKYAPALATVSLMLFDKIQLLAVLSMIEIGIGCTAASLATLRPLMRSLDIHLSSFTDLEKGSDQSNPTGSSYQKSSVPSNISESMNDPNSIHWNHTLPLTPLHESISPRSASFPESPTNNPSYQWNTTVPLSPLSDDGASDYSSNAQPIPLNYLRRSRSSRRASRSWFNHVPSIGYSLNSADVKYDDTAIDDKKHGDNKDEHKQKPKDKPKDYPIESEQAKTHSNSVENGNSKSQETIPLPIQQQPVHLKDSHIEKYASSPRQSRHNTDYLDWSRHYKSDRLKRN